MERERVRRRPCCGRVRDGACLEIIVFSSFPRRASSAGKPTGLPSLGEARLRAACVAWSCASPFDGRPTGDQQFAPAAARGPRFQQQSICGLPLRFPCDHRCNSPSSAQSVHTSAVRTSASLARPMAAIHTSINREQTSLLRSAEPGLGHADASHNTPPDPPPPQAHRTRAMVVFGHRQRAHEAARAANPRGFRPRWPRPCRASSGVGPAKGRTSASRPPSDAGSAPRSRESHWRSACVERVQGRPVKRRRSTAFLLLAALRLGTFRQRGEYHRFPSGVRTPMIE